MMAVVKRSARFLMGMAGVAGLVAGARADEVSAVEMMPVQSLAPHLSIMVDPTAELGIDEVLAGATPPFERNTSNIPSFGFTSAAVWLKFEIRNAGEEDQRLTTILNSARLDHFTWHVVEDGRVVQSLDAGAADEQRAKLYRFPRLVIDIPAGGVLTVYARSQSRTSQWLDLRIGCEQAINRSVVVEAMSDLALIGFSFAVAFFSLLFCFLQRQRFYLFLGSFAFTYLAYYAIFNGYLRLLWPALPLWVEREAFGVICGLSVLVFTQFNSSILGLYQSRRRVRVSQGMAHGFAILTVLLFVVLDFSVAIQWFALVQALTYLCGSLAVLLHPKRREVSRIPLMVTWFGWGIFVALLGLQFSNFVPIFIPFGLIQQLFVPVILGGFFLSVAYHQRTLDGLMLDLAKSQRAETSARLSALRYQINPHFLFNTLTSIDALSRSAPARIPELVGKLASFLRLRLLDSKDGRASLRQEMESLRAYLDIERLRFGDALKADFQIAPASLDAMVPELILQPLVENAVKYGFDEDRDVEIRIESAVADGRLCIVVTNPGSLDMGGNLDSGFGIGIENIRARLKLYYGDDAKFSIIQDHDHVVARIEIPHANIP
jgi:signal transduction histidine kinase